MKLPFELQEGEYVERIVRRHWLHIYPRLFLLVLAAAIPVIVLWFVALTRMEVGNEAKIGLAGVSALWLLFWSVRIFLFAYRYNNDMWTITNQRLIDSVRRHPFHLQVGSADLIHVQDLSTDRNGLIRTMFNFGDVECETASATGHFTLAAVPNPGDVQLLIDRLRDAQRAKSPQFS
jgi:hypothetical protein